MAVTAQHNLEVDKLIRLKLSRTELFCPTMTTPENSFINEVDNEAIEQDQRNEKRRVDWESECKTIETKSPLVDRISWDEADLKVKNLIHLSLGAEACRTFHQCNSHLKTDRSSRQAS